MGTTKATASTHFRLILLAAILLAVASVHAHSDIMSPTPAMAPYPAACGLCPPDKIAELEVCFESSLLGGIRLPRTLDGLRRCCRQIRAQIGLLLADEKVTGGLDRRAASSRSGGFVRSAGRDVIDGFGKGVDDVNSGLSANVLVGKSASAQVAECLCGVSSDSSDPARIANNVNTVLTACGEPLKPSGR